MIDWSALHSTYNVPNTQLVKFQAFDWKTSPTAFLLTYVAFPEFISITNIDTQLAFTFNKNCQHDTIFGANIFKIFGSTSITIKIIQWVEHDIPLKDPNEFFGKTMLTDFNDNPFQAKEQDMFDQDIFDN